jgi:hypothetical protein
VVAARPRFASGVMHLVGSASEGAVTIAALEHARWKRTGAQILWECLVREG